MFDKFHATQVKKNQRKAERIVTGLSRESIYYQTGLDLLLEKYENEKIWGKFQRDFNPTMRKT